MPILDQFTIQMPILIQPQPSHSHLHSSRSMTRRHSNHPHQHRISTGHQRQASKLHGHKLAVHRQELAQTTSILDQSEDSCACRRGTSELYGETEVSPRRTISQTKTRVSQISKSYFQIDTGYVNSLSIRANQTPIQVTIPRLVKGTSTTGDRLVSTTDDYTALLRISAHRQL